jgi:hypothetical protein
MTLRVDDVIANCRNSLNNIIIEVEELSGSSSLSLPIASEASHDDLDTNAREIQSAEPRLTTDASKGNEETGDNQERRRRRRSSAMVIRTGRDHPMPNEAEDFKDMDAEQVEVRRRRRRYSAREH